jgi:hypothetical protein
VWSDTGPAAYLDVDAVVTAATSAGCDMLHPGYGSYWNRVIRAPARHGRGHPALVGALTGPAGPAGSAAGPHSAMVRGWMNACAS